MGLRAVVDDKYKCVDLFAGGGGFSLGAIDAGIEVIAAVEYDKAAAVTYKENISKVQSPPPLLFNRDILSLEPDELLPSGGSCDLVLGGPPCQGFSVHRIKNSGVDDGRNKLILRYFQFVEHLKPKIFLMENVPGILWDRHKSYLEAFYAQGEAAGYFLHPPVVLDAQFYGVPQRRKRVFILGLRRDVTIPNISDLWPPKPSHGDNPTEGLEALVPAAEVFAAPIDAADLNNVHMQHSQALVDVFMSTPPNGGSRWQSGRILPCHASHNGHGDVYGRIDPSKPGPTMTTACINPSKGRFVHPVEHHGITARHAARFQTFPDWYRFHGGLMAAGKQIGNAVPVRLASVLLKTLVAILEKHESVLDAI